MTIVAPDEYRHAVSFPNESPDYRRERDALLQAEITLRTQTERVAALRRALPAGGEVPDDYVFEEGDDQGVRKVRLSDLFGDHDTLVVYSYMYGPDVEKPCPMCTSMLDGLNGQARHITQRVSLAVVAKSPAPRIREVAKQRDWRALRLLSSAGNSYNRDYHGETDAGGQLPILNVFTRKDGVIRHAYATELLFAPNDPGMNERHIDSIWPLWNLLDLTPGGRGAEWFPKLSYD